MGGESARALGPRDLDAAGFERLAQALEDVPVELRQLIEEEHAVVGERDLSRSRDRAAADERDGELVKYLVGGLMRWPGFNQ